eukprot:1441322-Rhodomonas_salina.1
MHHDHFLHTPTSHFTVALHLLVAPKNSSANATFRDTDSTEYRGYTGTDSAVGLGKDRISFSSTRVPVYPGRNSDLGMHNQVPGIQIPGTTYPGYPNIRVPGTGYPGTRVPG